MEQPNLPAENSTSTKVCANCGNANSEEGFPTPLCKTCRETFIKFPIPKWVLAFGAVVLLIFLYSMTKVPGNLSNGIHMKKGKKAVENQEYYTAQREFEIVKKKIPDYQSANEYLAISSFYNGDMQTFFATVSELTGKQIEDQDLYRQLNQLIDKSSDYFPSDSFYAVIEKYHSVDSIPGDIYTGYIMDHPEDIYSATIYAGILFHNDQYESCDSLLNYVLKKDAYHMNALELKTGVKRAMNQFDSSYYYCDRILELNHESAYAICSKARTFLKDGNDKLGLEWSLKGSKLQPGDNYAKATLALAYHFNNMTQDRDKLIREAENDSTAKVYFEYVSDVIEGKEPFR